jgi:hypothetical protein
MTDKCVFDREGDIATCTICDRSVKVPVHIKTFKINRACTGFPVETKEFPPVYIQAWNYAVSTFWHLFNLCRHAGKSVVARRFTQCKPCDWYTGKGDGDKRGRCIGCGCPVNDVDDGTHPNKLNRLWDTCPYKEDKKRKPKWLPIE